MEKRWCIDPRSYIKQYQCNATGCILGKSPKNGIWSDWSRIPVEIKIKVATVTPPIATESLMSRVLPALDGSTSVTLMVPTGYASYEWRRVGNNTSIGTANTLVVTTPGEYIARVTEQYGCSSSFSDPFAVVDANGANKPSPASNVVATTTSKPPSGLTGVITPLLNTMKPITKYTRVRVPAVLILYWQ